MSRKKTQDDDISNNIPDGADFKNLLKLFQKLVDQTVAQKRDERLGLYIKDAGK